MSDINRGDRMVDEFEVPTFTTKQVDYLIRLVNEHSMILEYLAEELVNWPSLDRATFVKAFTEQTRDLSHLIPASAEDAMSMSGYDTSWVE